MEWLKRYEDYGLFDEPGDGEGGGTEPENTEEPEVIENLYRFLVDFTDQEKDVYYKKGTYAVLDNENFTQFESIEDLISSKVLIAVEEPINPEELKPVKMVMSIIYNGIRYHKNEYALLNAREYAMLNNTYLTTYIDLPEDTEPTKYLLVQFLMNTNYRGVLYNKGDYTEMLEADAERYEDKGLVKVIEEEENNDG